MEIFTVYLYGYKIVSKDPVVHAATFNATLILKRLSQFHQKLYLITRLVKIGCNCN